MPGIPPPSIARREPTTYKGKCRSCSQGTLHHPAPPNEPTTACWVEFQGPLVKSQWPPSLQSIVCDELVPSGYALNGSAIGAVLVPNSEIGPNPSMAPACPTVVKFTLSTSSAIHSSALPSFSSFLLVFLYACFMAFSFFASLLASCSLAFLNF